MFKKDRQGKKEKRVALYIHDLYICSEVQKEVSGKPAESLCVKIKGEKRQKCYHGRDQP